MTAEDLSSIAAAIAARYTAANMPSPGGLAPVRLASATLPQGLTTLPAVLVVPDQGQMTAGGGTRRGHHRFLVRFYLAVRKDLARETNQLRTWLPTLIGQHQAGVQLGGLAGVASCRTDSWRLGELPYGGRVYAGVELQVTVETSIPWTVTA